MAELMKLNVLNAPVRPVWYCKQPAGGLDGLKQGIWVTLISHVRTVEAAAANVKATVAVAAAVCPTSMYTGKQKK